MGTIIEQQLSSVNAKIANATELVKQGVFLIIRAETLLAQIQGEIEEIYLSTGENQEKHEMPEST